MQHFNPVDLIIRKRDGRTLSPDEISTLVDRYTAGDVPDYQMSAFLMAGLLRGLDGAETAALTESMLHSGEVLDLSALPGRRVDKHSTGGVGDKISLILAPIVAACGVMVPMISGRGLGHTGGTLDKLESIPGFRTDLSTQRFVEILQRLGLCLIGQTAEIAPADRKLYALRDVTGTVEHIPYIAASIMSKKLAEGIDGLVLDVKCGRGAFMKTEADARRLAETLVSIGERAGKSCVARVTRMDVPLGRCIGNWPEVEESIAVLRGADVPDLIEITLALAADMLVLGEVARDTEEGHAVASEALRSGRAFERFVELAAAQGGDVRVLHEPASRPDVSEPTDVVYEGPGGYVQDIDGLALGKASVTLGAGRLRKEDAVDPTAGIVLNRIVGEAVRNGDVLARLHTRRVELADSVAGQVRQAYQIGTEPTAPKPLLLGRFSRDGWQ